MADKYTTSAICLLYILALGVSNSLQDIEGYYWKDFVGTIPDDAFIGGTDVDGGAIYIAKVLFDNKLIPGKVYAGGNVAFFEFDGPKSTTDNIMILCAQNHKRFAWISTTADNLPLLKHRHLIIGGYQEDLGTTTYIGRTMIDGELSVGKVFDGDHEYKGLWTVKDDKNYHFETFEVLAYNPVVKNA